MAETAARAKTVQKRKSNSEFARIMHQMSKNKLAMAGLTIFLIELAAVLLAPVIIPYDYTLMDMTAIQQGPSMKHIFGTDELGVI